MDTCVGCRIVVVSVYCDWPEICDLGPIRGCVLSTIININRPDGATCSQNYIYIYVWGEGRCAETTRARGEYLCVCGGGSVWGGCTGVLIESFVARSTWHNIWSTISTAYITMD